MDIQALLVDDEPDGRAVMKKLLGKFCPEIKIVAEAGSVPEAYEMIINLKPQVVFLDIQMPGSNGFELLKKFRVIPFEVVFVTSHDKYAIEAIKFSALDYLLKPIEVEELQKTVAKLEEIIERKVLRQEQLVNVIIHVENPGIEKKIAVHVNDNVHLLPLSEIVYLESERNYTNILTLSGDKYTSSKNLGEFEDMLETYPQFLRIGKSCIANLNHVTDYSKGEPCMLFIANKWSFEISRRKKQEVLERLKK
jgi:two-component system, LytTR family, response regulator